MNKHVAIIIPGLGDKIALFSILKRHWQNNGVELVVYSLGWRDKENFDSKLKKLTQLIDEQHAKKGIQVSLIGCSAGGSAILNAFIERKNSLHKVINICGRLRTGKQKGFRSLKTRSKSSISFNQAVKLFEQQENLLSSEDRKRIMTIRALLGDELVPSDTTTINGAYNLAIPTVEYSISIILALTILSKSLISFLKDTN
jgi:hypothetical protein